MTDTEMLDWQERNPCSFIFSNGAHGGWWSYRLQKHFPTLRVAIMAENGIVAGKAVETKTADYGFKCQDDLLAQQANQIQQLTRERDEAVKAQVEGWKASFGHKDADFQACKRTIDQLTADLASWKEHAAQSDKELCQLQDALGCPCEMTNPDGSIRDNQVASLERLRDLIAAEGQLGDYKTLAEDWRLKLVEETKLHNARCADLATSQARVEVLEDCIENLPCSNFGERANSDSEPTECGWCVYCKMWDSIQPTSGGKLLERVRELESENKSLKIDLQTMGHTAQQTQAGKADV